MLSLILFILSAWGLSNILAKMKVSDSLRKNDRGEPRTNPVSQMLACPACNGFWIGVLFYAIGWRLIEVTVWCDWFLQGCLCSGACWSIYAIVNCTNIYDY